jgi:Rad3-related DNA helicase
VKIDRDVTSKEQFLEWLRENDVTRKISAKLDTKNADDDGESIASELSKAEHDAMKELGHKIEIFLRYVERGEWSIATETYYVKGDLRKKIMARPLYAKDFAEELLFQHADRVLAMSATILDKDLWARNLGLDPATVEIISLPSDFPVENRPIFLTYAGNCGKKYFTAEANPKNPTKPKLIEAVKRIMQRHEGQRGLIHCQSNEMKRVILDEVRDSRFLDQETFNNDKEAMLHVHASRPDSVVVAPSMTEGYDFAGDLCRFQIIAKMPWPSLGDKVIKERADRDPAWYAWNCALRLVQAYGRGVRGKEDWAFCYLLDQGFEMFAGRNSKLIPQWVRDAFQRYAPTEIRRN